MKKIIAIIFLAILIVFPAIAAGMGEVYGAAATGALSGGAIGALAGPAGIVIGAIAGAIIGGIGGSLISEANIQAEEKKEEAQNLTKIEELEAVTIPQTEAEISAGYQALARWQSSYDSSLAQAQDQAESNLDVLKSNWGLYNANLASLNREGATSRLLSQKQKNRVITYAGEDMELNSEDAINAARSVYEDMSNFDENGNMNEKGAEKLKLIGSQYGVYEKDLFNLAADLYSQKNATETTIGLNRKALEHSQESIERLKKRNVEIQERRW